MADSFTGLVNKTTEALIEDYNERRANRHYKAPLGGPRARSRQLKINELVDEISRRADQGDAVALAWYDK